MTVSATSEDKGPHWTKVQGATSARPELRILTGIHRGAAVHPGQVSLTIGSDPACDIVLLDDGICGEHLVLEPHFTDGNLNWQVFMSDPDALAKDGNGQCWISGAVLGLGDPICVGGVWCSIVPSDASWVYPSPDPVSTVVSPTAFQSVRPGQRLLNFGRGRPLTSAGVILGLLGFVLALVFKSSLPLPSISSAMAATAAGDDIRVPLGEAVSAVPRVHDSTEEEERPAAQTPTELDLSNAKLEARRVFRERGLQKISVSFISGQLRISAELDESQRTKFENALLALDKRLSGRIEISAQMSPPPNDLPFSVQQVLMGPTSRVVLSDGRILHVGDSAEGVKLMAVRPGKLQFMAKRVVEVPW